MTKVHKHLYRTPPNHTLYVISYWLLQAKNRKLRQRRLRNARQSEHHLIQLLYALGLDRLKPMSQHCVIRRVPQRLHLGPFPQEPLAQLIAQPG